jgi:hypothetical protein
MQNFQKAVVKNCRLFELYQEKNVAAVVLNKPGFSTIGYLYTNPSVEIFAQMSK